MIAPSVVMPNFRLPNFRFRQLDMWDDRDEMDDDLPSPISIADSEETFDNKVRWTVLARWVLSRWRTYISAPARCRRALFFLERFCFFPDLPDGAVHGVAKYM